MTGRGDVAVVVEAARFVLARHEVTVTGLMRAISLSRPEADAVMLTLARWRVVAQDGPGGPWLVLIDARYGQQVVDALCAHRGRRPRVNPLRPLTTRGLRQRWRDILSLVAEGYTNQQIGKKLDISEHTVKSHVNRMIRHFRAGNRAHLVSLGYQQGFLTVPNGGSAPSAHALRLTPG